MNHGLWTLRAAISGGRSPPAQVDLSAHSDLSYPLDLAQPAPLLSPLPPITTIHLPPYPILSVHPIPPCRPYSAIFAPLEYSRTCTVHQPTNYHQLTVQ